MSEVCDYKKRIDKLKAALLEFLGTNGRYYGQMTRLEQAVEDLTQALNTRLDQVRMGLKKGQYKETLPETPRERLATRMFDTALKLSQGGKVDQEMADEFGTVLEAFDHAADLKRQSESVKETAETAAIKHKRGRS